MRVSEGLQVGPHVGWLAGERGGRRQPCFRGCATATVPHSALSSQTLHRRLKRTQSRVNQYVVSLWHFLAGSSLRFPPPRFGASPSRTSARTPTARCLPMTVACPPLPLPSLPLPPLPHPPVVHCRFLPQTSSMEGDELVYKLYARVYTPIPLVPDDLVLFEEQGAAPHDGTLDPWMEEVFQKAFGGASGNAARLNALIAPAPLIPRSEPLRPQAACSPSPSSSTPSPFPSTRSFIPTLPSQAIPPPLWRRGCRVRCRRRPPGSSACRPPSPTPATIACQPQWRKAHWLSAAASGVGTQQRCAVFRGSSGASRTAPTGVGA